MRMDYFVILLLCLSPGLVKGDYFSEYFVKWLMREKMECVFEEFDVSENVLTHVPENMLKVRLGNTQVLPGDKFSPLNLVSPPNVTWDCEDPHIKHGAEIAIVMVGADPDNQTLIWLVENITGCDVNTGQEVCKYRPPGPAGAGAHLYVICQFMRQPSYNTFKRIFPRRSTINPQNFSMAEFAKRGNYGDPYACNFIVLQNETDTSATNEQVHKEDNHDCDVFGEMYMLI